MIIDPPQRYPPYTMDKTAVVSMAFYPPVNYYYNKFVTAAGDVRNLGLLALSAYTMRGMLKGKL